MNEALRRLSDVREDDLDLRLQAWVYGFTRLSDVSPEQIERARKKYLNG